MAGRVILMYFYREHHLHLLTHGRGGGGKAELSRRAEHRGCFCWNLGGSKHNA